MMIASDNRLLFDDIARYHLFFFSSQQLKNLIQLAFSRKIPISIFLA